MACHSASSRAWGSAKRAKAPACWASSRGLRLPPVNRPALRAARSSRRACWRKPGPWQTGRGRGVEEVAHLLAEGLVFGPVQPRPQRLARQGYFQRPPGVVVGLLEGGRQAQAVVGEALRQERDHAIDGRLPEFQTD